MCKDDSTMAQPLELEELDGATGGKLIYVHGKKPETCKVSCPRCGCEDIAGIDETHFDGTWEGSNFLDNTNLMCNKCHFFAKGRRFKLTVI